MKIIVSFKYDFDQELGYTEQEIEIDEEDIEMRNGKMIINMYGEFKEN